MLSVGSLFSGIGGFDLGLERAGMRTAWFCEQDEFCQRVLAKHWPGIPCYDDVRELSGATVQPVDVLCGGFPCQDISLAGKGAGIDGTRSGLWSEYARLIGELRPRYVCVENVSALLARGLGRVLGDLAAFGYDAEWDCIPASAVGAPHRRDRLWLVAYSQRDELWKQSAGVARGDVATVAGNDGSSQSVADAEVVAFRPGLRANEPSGKRGRRSGNSGGPHGDLADSASNGRGSGRSRRSDPGGARQREQSFQAVADANGEPTLGPPIAWAQRNPWPAEPDVPRMAHGIPNGVDRRRALGNALVPQIAEWIGRRIVAYEEGRLAA